MIKTLLLSAIGSSILMLIISRALPNTKLEKWFSSLGNKWLGFKKLCYRFFYNNGKIVTTTMVLKLSKPAWEKIEKFFINSVEVGKKAFIKSSKDKLNPEFNVSLFSICWRGFKNGLQSNNLPNK